MVIEMMRRKYLIWLDILGFDKLALEIAGKSDLTNRKVRRDFINTIKERVDVASNEYVIGKNYGRKDDWILVTESLDSAFKSVFEILNHNTEYLNYKKIPLEIAIGTGEYDRWAILDEIDLIIERARI
jgi:hypothetical protein